VGPERGSMVPSVWVDSLPLRFAPAGNDKGAMPDHGGTFPAALS
jgi:hypothetical protein